MLIPFFPDPDPGPDGRYRDGKYPGGVDIGAPPSGYWLCFREEHDHMAANYSQADRLNITRAGDS
jgi:hypothetical protein